MKKLFLFLGILFCFINNSFATHNKAGEITYKHLASVTTDFRYAITVTTYTNTYQTSADRCELVVYFGDGDSAAAPRINGSSAVCAFPLHDGDMLSNFPNTKLNIYYIEHTYPGNGAYNITVDDMNRNAGTCNIPNSVNTSFSLVSELLINPFLGFNDSPVLLNYPLDDACVGVCFEHNPGAYDPDANDSLSYSLTTCYASRGVLCPGYFLPPNMTLASIDPRRGDLRWCAPTQPCQYNIAILIKQYRRFPGDPTRYYIGSVLRDMQITVGTCANNPPHINNVPDTCIVAGTNLHFNVSATDAQFNAITLEASGGPFQVNPAATFSSTPSLSPVTGTFNWTPNCSEVQLLSYLVTFKATDQDAVQPLVDYQSVFIRVVAPAPTIVSATPNGASIIVDWNDAPCNNTLGENPLLGYNIYRKNICDPWVHSPCETGVPTYTGYTLIGTTGTTPTIFTDNNNGQGLISGIDYSYIVSAFYSDGSQSYASANVCATLVRDVPIITNVSVLNTSNNTGSIWIHWVKPLAAPPNLDTVANPPPYQFRLMRAQGISGTLNFTQVSPPGSYMYSSFYQITDTGFVDMGINTQDSGYTYRVDFYYGTPSNLKGSTNSASSVFLTSTPAGNQVHLSWQEIVPWINYRYDIYKETSLGSFTFLDSSTSQSYIDTGLVNGTSYCYKIVSVGQYSDSALPRPLYNTSERRCEIPIDIVPPCQPHFMVENDCGIYQNIISWTNPNTYCSHDAVQYNIYFAPTSNDALQLIANITDINTTSFTHTYLYDGVPSVAGCYAVTAIDTAGNESPVVTKTCVDNCPEYELPNVFTPNGDGINDFVTPLPGYRYVKDIDMKIFDRWGVLMFETSDKDILWDGKSKEFKMPASDGVYFYVCIVNEIHVDGIRQRELKGFIQLLHEKTSPAR